MLGKEITVSSESQLKSICFYLTDYGNPEADFSYCVYRFSDKDYPDTEIHHHSSVRASSSGNEWITLSLEHEEVILTPGKYLVAIKWPVSPGEDGKSAITLGFKESDEVPVSWMNWHGKWLKDTGPYKGNFMIEAEYGNPVVIEKIIPPEG